MKVIIFDSSSLISLSLNGLLEELKKLKNIFNGYFIITNEVKEEIIDRPLKIKKFQLEAIKLQGLLDEKFLTMPKDLQISDKEISDITEKFLSLANSIFSGNNQNITLIHSGEASCLALSKILNNKNIKNVLAIDERTLRMLVEKPDKLKEFLKEKLHQNIKLKKTDFEDFKGFKIIRSTELMYVAYKKGLIKWKNKEILDALLYALKFKGCAISSEEIEEIKRIK